MNTLLTPTILERETQRLLGNHYKSVTVKCRSRLKEGDIGVQCQYHNIKKERFFTFPELAMRLDDMSDKYLAPLANEILPYVSGNQYIHTLI